MTRNVDDGSQRAPKSADAYPRFAELPIRSDAPAASSWGVFGADDEVGTLNFIGPEKVRDAARLVERGVTFNLDLPLDLPHPPFFAREPYTHGHLRLGEGIVRDDVLDRFYPQGSSQWDALCHYAHRRHGFYNGVKPEEVTGSVGSRLGIEHWARRGIASRGVLIDVARYLEARGHDLLPTQEFPICASLLEEILQQQETRLAPGDVLLIRTGWLAHYLAASPDERAAIQTDEAIGLAAEDETAAFFWDHRVAAAVTDTPSFEVQPTRKESRGSLHRRLIPLLGMAIGELWNLEELASDCLDQGSYTCFLVSSPLHLRAGAGSTANALAFR